MLTLNGFSRPRKNDQQQSTPIEPTNIKYPSLIQYLHPNIQQTCLTAMG